MSPIGPEGSELVLVQKQLGLLLWKSFTIKTRGLRTTAFYFGLPFVVFFMIWILYETFGIDSNGIIELLVAPFAFIMVLQLTCVSLVSEKSTRLRESMRMMGMREMPYWLSYLVADGIAMNLMLSLFLAAFSAACSLFNGTGFGDMLFFFFSYGLSLTALAFALSSTLDAPQTAGQIAFLTLVSGIAIFLVIFLGGVSDLIDTHAKVQAWCLYPPMAIQLGIYAICDISLVYHQECHTDDGTTFKSCESVADEKVSMSTISWFLILDTAIYSFLAWYLAQVLPSEYGIQQPFWFLFNPSYWCPRKVPAGGYAAARLDDPLIDELEGAEGKCPTEVVDQNVTGSPTVSVRSLRKTFSNFKAVQGISFDLYDGQIFSLLGHNGAGKTTTINMLTGLFAADSNSGATTIYGADISNDMTEARKNLGICPQHDVLFEQLTCREHIVFFSLLKGSTELWDEAGAESDELLEHFHLHERAFYVGSELSGGMKRKLSSAIALCGGSKFVILDEPTAGMDPLARRELWDLLKEYRHGRTMLLTTHYMDEADVLGDRIAIMSRGELQCIGSSPFLKRTFGAGYKLIMTMAPGTLDDAKDNGKAGASVEDHPATRRLLDFIARVVPDVSVATRECTFNSLVFVLPFDAVANFGQFFDELDLQLVNFGVQGYSVAITDLEEVFLKVGEDHTLRDSKADGAGLIGAAGANGAELTTAEIGARSDYVPSLLGQAQGLWKKRVSSAMNDVKTIPLIMLPILVAVAGFTCNVTGQFGTAGTVGANIATAAIIFMGYIPMPGLLAEGVVSERTTKLRNVLTVMGCDLKSYWLGVFMGDFTLFMMSAVPIWIIAIVCSQYVPSDDDDFSYFPSGGNGTYPYGGNSTNTTVVPNYDDDGDLEKWMSGGNIFFLVPLFGLQICSFSYALSFSFSSPRLAIVFMPFLSLILIFVPLIVVSVFQLGLGSQGANIVDPSSEAIIGSILWGVTLCSPHGALGLGLASTATNLSKDVSNYPPFWAVCMIMGAESILYLVATYRVDRQSLIALTAGQSDGVPQHELDEMDEDVRKERSQVLAMDHQSITSGEYGLRFADLNKTFPPKTPKGAPLRAVKDLNLRLPQGQLFGLLGANGAGKTTAISCVMRSLYPTTGDIHVCGDSVLSNFRGASSHLGVVTQHNTLWDRLSCVDHLKLFARLRGVPDEYVKPLVRATLKEMELEPYAHKLAMQLSGGMKRKLCVAIALIGDPKVGGWGDYLPDFFRRFPHVSTRSSERLPTPFPVHHLSILSHPHHPKVVLLDEPSAGLDPVSRRNLWDVITKTMQSRSVVLTTHSMEEAEALCTRIGIMVKGSLRILGTPQHLKEKFGSGYEIILQIAPPGLRGSAEQGQEDPESFRPPTGTNAGEKAMAAAGSAALAEAIESSAMEVANFIGELFKGASLLSNNGGLLTFRVPRESMRMGTAFSALEANKERLGITDYAVTQPTLEQVFVRTVVEHSAGERPAVATPVAAGAKALTPDGLNRASSAGSTSAPSPWVRASIGDDAGVPDAPHMSIMDEAQAAFDGEQLRTNFCGLNRQSHRFLAVMTGLFALFNLLMVSGLFGPFKYANDTNDDDCPRTSGQPCQVAGFYLNAIVLLISMFVSIFACAGCCFCIPNNPEEQNQ